jgi:CBS domain-containing protein
MMTTQLVRDAMVPDPLALETSSTARDAGEALSRDAVRAVLITESGVLVGVVTRKTLVREVVAHGRDPQRTTLGEIAEEPNATLESSMPLDDAFAFLEEHDYERVPVVENGKLVGVLSRSGVQRRLAEDEPPQDLVEA